MLGLKLNHVSKRGHRPFSQWHHSFQLKGVVPLSNRPGNASSFLDNINLCYYIKCMACGLKPGILFIEHVTSFPDIAWSPEAVRLNAKPSHYFEIGESAQKCWSHLSNFEVIRKLWNLYLQYLKVSEGLLIICFITVRRNPRSTGPSRWTGSRKCHYVLLAMKVLICHWCGTSWVTNHVVIIGTYSEVWYCIAIRYSFRLFLLWL